ncbi:MAG: glutamine--fructose-6-phosphate transaminase (isomerizing) [Sphingobacteriia bacterium]|nr:glutamine--fructose-6-phosphate transaminase (isomerizing) [Sphingobacteriia bacterium]
MCGIVGYIGKREALPVLINGLKRLEYRGYDSAGVAIQSPSGIQIVKKVGKVSVLEQTLLENTPIGNVGMGHTRWATHGAPSDLNAHPHLSQSGKFAIIHNGIIENYTSLKKRLQQRGYVFKSDTDTEVLAHLIEEVYTIGKCTAEIAVRLALTKVEGAYGLVVMCEDEPNKLICARKGSPLVIGIGEAEYFVASDATPIIEYTKNVIYLNDGDVAIITPDDLTLKTIKNVILSPEIKTLDMEMDEIEKGGYEHFMLKEIFEQPKTVLDSLRGRVSAEHEDIRLGGLTDVMDQLISAKRILIVACGTSWHAGLVAEYIFEELVRIPVEVEYASEFRYRNPVILPGDVVLAISQSGETADTLAAIQLAKSQGALVLGICNVVGASIPRETHGGVYTHAGPEIGVASTKAFTAQVSVLTLIAIHLGYLRKSLTVERYHELVKELLHIPDKIAETLTLNDSILEMAERFKNASNFLYLGRGYQFPVALEGALKLKEISYIHAEGYPAAEMKHGPIALIDENMPVVIIATRDKTYDKIVSNIQEVKARKGQVIAVVSAGDTTIRQMSDYVMEIPITDEILAPLLTVIPLQLLSYHIAVLRGCNVDQPRNLAKSVTVE